MARDIWIFDSRAERCGRYLILQVIGQLHYEVKVLPSSGNLDCRKASKWITVFFNVRVDRGLCDDETIPSFPNECHQDLSPEHANKRGTSWFQCVCSDISHHDAGSFIIYPHLWHNRQVLVWGSSCHWSLATWYFVEQTSLFCSDRLRSLWICSHANCQRTSW